MLNLPKYFLSVWL